MWFWWVESNADRGRGGAVLVEQGKMAKHLTHFVKKKMAELLP